MTEKTEKIIIKLPWSKIAVLIATLIRSAQGGITKEEGEKLLELLTEIVVSVAEVVSKK